MESGHPISALLIPSVTIALNNAQVDETEKHSPVMPEALDDVAPTSENWLRAMPGDPPKAIITDQDPAMTKAISQVMPQTFHRLCAWHIMNKVPEKLGRVTHIEVFKSRFKDLIWNSEYVDEFESNWSGLLLEFGLQDHEWLDMIYQIRHRWIPVYLKHMFFAGMSTTQRSENMNFVIKQYVNRKNSFSDFIIRFERGLARQRHRELMADDASKSTIPKLKTPLTMEKEMAKVLTRKIFFTFQDELLNVMMYSVDEKYILDGIMLFEVTKLEENRRGRQVSFDPHLRYAVCSCHKFEFEGVPCSHILCVLRHVKIAYLPEQYVMKRWTINAREGSLFDNTCVKSKQGYDDGVVLRHLELSQLVLKIGDEGALSNEAFGAARDSCVQLLNCIREINIKDGATRSHGNQKHERNNNETTYRDPQLAKPKGSLNRKVVEND